MNVRVGDPFSGHEAVSITSLVTPIVLCGGPCLWQFAYRPKARFSAEPSSPQTIFQSTLSGLIDSAYAPSFIVTSPANRALVERQIGGLDLEPKQVSCETAVWNETAALLDKVAQIASADPEAILLIVRPDHQIRSQSVLDQAVALGLQMARDGRIVLFGLRPDRPATDRAWIAPSDNLQIAAKVRTYLAKPALDQALTLFAYKNALHDAGVLLVSARTLLEEAAKTGTRSETNSRSIGQALLEKSERLSVVRVSAGWHDSARGQDTAAPVAGAQTTLGRLAEAADVAKTGSGIETRPWGRFEILDGGEGYQVKRLTVKPGGRLSLQSHRHRAEHWVVVQGQARITIGKTVSNLSANASVFIPLGEVHRLENLQAKPLVLIEVQSGSHLAEDDITRYHDVYDRV